MWAIWGWLLVNCWVQQATVQFELRMLAWISVSCRRPFVVLKCVDTLRQPWITVEWSRFPKRRPICLRGSWASSRKRYIAMCLASAMGLARLGPGRLVSGTEKYRATPSMIACGDGVEEGLGGGSAAIASVATVVVMGDRVRLAYAATRLRKPSSSRTLS